jgi:hypothetical protein
VGLYVSTTGTNVIIPELGITIVHPTTDRDLGAQFDVEDIQKAATLTSNIVAGTLVWKKTAGGTVQTPANYDGDFLELETMNTGSGLLDERGTLFKNLIAAVLLPKCGSVAAVSFTGSPRKATVTFATARANANYGIQICGTDVRSWSWESKTASGFVINSNANAALTGPVDWEISSYGETNYGVTP